MFAGCFFFCLFCLFCFVLFRRVLFVCFLSVFKYIFWPLLIMHKDVIRVGGESFRHGRHNYDAIRAEKGLTLSFGSALLRAPSKGSLTHGLVEVVTLSQVQTSLRSAL